MAEIAPFSGHPNIIGIPKEFIAHLGDPKIPSDSKGSCSPWKNCNGSEYLNDGHMLRTFMHVFDTFTYIIDKCMQLAKFASK